jgi:hypothetical protein
MPPAWQHILLIAASITMPRSQQGIVVFMNKRYCKTYARSTTVVHNFSKAHIGILFDEEQELIF